MGKGAKAPDVIGAAKVEGEQTQSAQRDQIYADRPDQYNAFGSNTWGQESYVDPATGERTTRWTQAEGLSPDMQGLLDSQMAGAKTQAGMYGNAMNRAQADMANPMDWSQFGEYQGPKGAITGDERFNWDSQNRGRAENAAYGRATSRLDPRFAQEASANEVALRNKGLRPGDEAYDAAMGNFGRTKNDAYEQAFMGSVDQGRMEDQQSFGQGRDQFTTNLGADQQQFNQQLETTNAANALRDKTIEEKLGQRRFNLGEASALNPNSQVADMTSTYSTGGG